MNGKDVPATRKGLLHLSQQLHHVVLVQTIINTALANALTPQQARDITAWFDLAMEKVPTDAEAAQVMAQAFRKAMSGRAQNSVVTP